MNTFFLVGKYLDNPSPKIIRLKVDRPYKNDNGEFESDILPIQLFETSSNIFDYLKRGDTIGVRGKITSLEPTHTPQLVAEKLTFLSSNKTDETRDKMGKGEI